MLYTTAMPYSSILYAQASTPPASKAFMPDHLQNYPILDMQQIQRVVLNNPDILQALKVVFSEDTQQRLETLESLRQHSGNVREPVKKVLHALKGEARSIAAVRLGELAYQLEQLASEDDLAAVFAHLPLLHREFQNWQDLANNTDWQAELAD